jgi:hypothetical protein
VKCCSAPLVLLILATASMPARAASHDDCGTQLPASLARAVAAEFPAYRLPRQSDSDSTCVEDHRRAHRNLCLLIARADFDGDGREDVAVLLPSRRAKTPPKLVVALARGKRWQLEELRIGNDPSVRHFVIGTIRPGTYTETDAIPHKGKAPAVTTTAYGVMMAACDSWSNGYFRVQGKWTSIALSD